MCSHHWHLYLCPWVGLAPDLSKRVDVGLATTFQDYECARALMHLVMRRELWEAAATYRVCTTCEEKHMGDFFYRNFAGVALYAERKGV
jgi:hypothetical protein